jgi:transposase
MPKRIRVELSKEQIEELENTRHQAKKAYLRERAAAVLKVSEGQSLSEVAERGLLIRHEPETVHGWIKSYLQQGLSAWEIAKGRGRKAAFSPKKSNTGGR